MKEIEDIRQAVLQDKRSNYEIYRSIGVSLMVIVRIRHSGKMPLLRNMEIIAKYYGLASVRERLMQVIELIYIRVIYGHTTYNKIINAIGRYDYKLKKALECRKIDNMHAETIEKLVDYIDNNL